MLSKLTSTQKIIGLVVVIVVFVVGRNFWRSDEAGTDPVAEVARLVKAIRLQAYGQSALRTFPGRVQAAQNAELAFEVNGKLTAMPVKEGEEVRKGALLAQLDKRDYENRYKAAQAQATEAAQQLKRSERLFKEGALPEADLDQQRAKAQTLQAEAAMAQKALEDTEIRAPFAGVLAKRHVDNHQNIQAKQVILTLQDLSRVEVIIGVPERDVYSAQRERPGKLSASFSADPTKRYALTVKEVSTEADAATQTYAATLIMDKPEGVNIFSGMTATVYWEPPVVAGTQPDAFPVPVTAILGDEENKSYLWRMDPTTMRITKIEVTRGELTGSNLLVRGPLKAGDWILTAGVHYARENMLVSLLNGEAK